MSHKEQKEYCKSIKDRFPEHFTKKTVLDVGSGDINGNNNWLFTESFILGCDVAYGPNVSMIAFCHELPFVNEFFDTIISTETLEHDRYYDKTLKSIVRMLKPGGLFLMTCATTGRPEHGTSRSKPYQVFATRRTDLEDYYKNLTEEDIRDHIDIEKNFSEFQFSIEPNHHDLFFFGIKR